MALSISTSTLPHHHLLQNSPHRNFRKNTVLLITKCESSSSPSKLQGGEGDGSSKLVVGSAVIVVEAPKTIKTAASVPCLRLNTGLVKVGDVGRIVARKPKDVWAIRLAIGTYLIDAKHFKPLILD
ncbi:hypothetical protein Syun_016703 [Stephania yunnanensis]|uniref:Chlororespiratory reduction 42 n=1 Tax=Stephania yunnanensis TaxID=152371 RepID=A0AAP0J7Y0_9MAGN